MSIALCWIRRDLRLHDHHALWKATSENQCVHMAFVFDPFILNSSKNSEDKRVQFILDSLLEMELALKKNGHSIHILYGDPQKEIPLLMKKIKANRLYFNRDYMPYAKKRDKAVAALLLQENYEVFSFKDHVGLEKDEVLNGKNEHFKVFTPYKNKWIAIWNEQMDEVPTFNPNLKKLAVWDNPESIASTQKIDWAKKIGHIPCKLARSAGSIAGLKRLQDFSKKITAYHQTRDFPAIEGTSGLSTYLRHGNVSVRDLLRLALQKKDKGHSTWLSEIIWRDFYQMVLDVWPHVCDSSFKPQYDAIQWQGSQADYKAWCEGKTGVPIVDASMRCLNETGEMPNRLRMVAAQYLCKILLIDWRKGEAWFAQKLLDFDLAANNGGWQWCSSTGCDAVPYFRIFNPYLQSQKFDPEGVFIRRWCPELEHLPNTFIHRPECMNIFEQMESECMIGEHYPHPIAHYEEQRSKAIAMYKAALSPSKVK